MGSPGSIITPAQQQALDAASRRQSATAIVNPTIISVDGHSDVIPRGADIMKGNDLVNALRFLNWFQTSLVGRTAPSTNVNALVTQSKPNGWRFAAGNAVGLSVSQEGIQWTKKGWAWGGARALVWAPELSTWLCAPTVSTGGYVLLSQDGFMWKARNLPTSGTGNQMKAAVWTGTQFVIVGGSLGNVFTSPDGLNWTLSSTGIVKNANGLAWNGSLLVAVGGTGAGVNNVWTSPDGINWTVLTTPSGTFGAVTWNGSIFMAAGPNIVMTSPDGTNWTSKNTARSPNAIAFSPSLNLWVALEATTPYYSSDSGATWSASSMTTNMSVAVIWNGSMFIAVGTSAVFYATSTNGTSWTQRAWPAMTNTGAAYTTLGFGGPSGTMILAGNNTAAALSDNFVVSSQDGLLWTASTITGNNASINDVAASDTLGLLVANGTYVSLSTDMGRSFKGYSTGLTFSCLSAGVGLFVGITSAGAAKYSSDGITWNNGSGITSPCTKVIFGGGKFVAVGTNCCFTSTDGMNWTSRTIPTGSYNQIVWNGTQYLAVAAAGASATSPDGITWTPRTIPSATYSGLAWNGTYYLAVTSTSAVRSLDGITWTNASPSGTGTISVMAVGSTFVANALTTIFTSTDNGMTWTSSGALVSSGQIASFVVSHKGAIVTVGTAGSWFSVDLVNWFTYYKVVQTPDYFDVVVNGSTAVAIGDWVADISTDNGSNWARYLIGNQYPLRSIACDGTKYVAVGYNGAATSPDGITWTQRTIPAGFYKRVIWTGAIFIAVGLNVAAVSPDGINWTSSPIPAGNWKGLGFNSSTIVAVGVGCIVTCTNGFDWTSVSCPVTTALNGVAWSGLVWLACGPGVAIVSNDATSWRQVGMTIAASASCNAVLWDGMQFIVAGDSQLATSGVVTYMGG